MEEEDDEELVDMSKYDLDGPVEYDESIRPFVPAETMIKRTCHNPDCNWEEMIGENQRFCPVCQYEIKGWKPRDGW